MRIWDLPVNVLCRQHLLGEHRELHTMYVIIKEKRKTPYANHPETKRWVNRIDAMLARHQEQVIEMQSRGYNHNSELPPPNPYHVAQDKFLATPEEQVNILREKGCNCKI